MATSAETAQPSELDPEIDPELFARLVTFRRDLHAHPELSWKENRTAKRITERLDALGVAWRPIVGTGIIADLPGPPDVPIVALRGDTDALPVQEETGLEFASTVPGVMHACGHDGHTTIALGALELLLAEERPAPVRVLFQPAEEYGEGAHAMVESGALDGVGMIFGGHLDRHYDVGKLVVTEGAVNASTDTFFITIHGRGGHGARPHEAVDAVVVASLIVIAIQTIISREVDPAEPSVITVGKIDAGTASNVIAARARMEGTIRSQSPEVRARLKASLKRVTAAVGTLHGAEVELEIRDGTPPLINSPEMAALAREAAVETVGEANVVPLNTANMGGEDFSYFLDVVPGAYLRYGGLAPGAVGYPAHSSRFDFDERALAIGARFLCNLALRAGRRLAAEARS